MAQLTQQIPTWPSQVMAAVVEIATKRGWKVVRKDFNEAEIRTKTSALSLGEKIVVRAYGDRLSPAISTVTVTSNARFRVHARAKSRNTVDLVMNSIKERFPTTVTRSLSSDRRASSPNPEVRPGTDPVPEDIKFCAMCGKKLAASAIFCVVCGARQD